MRVDKYLWCIRIYKSRSIATEQCNLNKVQVKSEPVKASREVRQGDVLDVRKGAITFSYKVLGFPTSRVGAKLLASYVEDVTTDVEKKKLEIILLQRHNERPRGLGRPTKKDRREMDDFFTPDEWDL